MYQALSCSSIVIHLPPLDLCIDLEQMILCYILGYTIQSIIICCIRYWKNSFLIGRLTFCHLNWQAFYNAYFKCNCAFGLSVIFFFHNGTLVFSEEQWRTWANNAHHDTLLPYKSYMGWLVISGSWTIANCAMTHSIDSYSNLNGAVVELNKIHEIPYLMQYIRRISAAEDHNACPSFLRTYCNNLLLRINWRR